MGSKIAAAHPRGYCFNSHITKITTNTFLYQWSHVSVALTHWCIPCILIFLLESWYANKDRLIIVWTFVFPTGSKVWGFNFARLRGEGDLFIFPISDFKQYIQSIWNLKISIPFKILCFSLIKLHVSITAFSIDDCFWNFAHMAVYSCTLCKISGAFIGLLDLGFFLTLYFSG